MLWTILLLVKIVRCVTKWRPLLTRAIFFSMNYRLQSQPRTSILERCRELYATGNDSDREVAIALNGAGFRTKNKKGSRLFSKDAVSSKPKNPIYTGFRDLPP